MRERARVLAPGDLATVVDPSGAACLLDLMATGRGITAVNIPYGTRVTVLAGPSEDRWRIEYMLVLAPGGRPVWAVPEDLRGINDE